MGDGTGGEASPKTKRPDLCRPKCERSERPSRAFGASFPSCHGAEVLRWGRVGSVSGPPIRGPACAWVVGWNGARPRFRRAADRGRCGCDPGRALLQRPRSGGPETLHRSTGRCRCRSAPRPGWMSGRALWRGGMKRPSEGPLTRRILNPVRGVLVGSGSGVGAFGRGPARLLGLRHVGLACPSGAFAGAGLRAADVRRAR